VTCVISHPRKQRHYIRRATEQYAYTCDSDWALDATVYAFKPSFPNHHGAGILHTRNGLGGLGRQVPLLCLGRVDDVIRMSSDVSEYSCWQPGRVRAQTVTFKGRKTCEDRGLGGASHCAIWHISSDRYVLSSLVSTLSVGRERTTIGQWIGVEGNDDLRAM
jgi:hypothetical protein